MIHACGFCARPLLQRHRFFGFHSTNFYREFLFLKLRNTETLSTKSVMIAVMRSEIDAPSADAQSRMNPDRSFLRREILLATEWVRLLLRDPKKYFSITASLYAADATGKTNGIRAAYFFCRHIDDIADGDRDAPSGHEDFPALIEALRRQADGGPAPAGVSGALLSHALQAGDAPDAAEVAECMKTFLDTTRFDYSRRIERTVLSANALDLHYERSFGPAHDLACICAGSDVRAHHLAPLQLLQGKAYALRDLSHELPRGEINIPDEVVQRAGMPVEELMTQQDVFSVQAISEWAARERCDAQRLLAEMESKATGEIRPILNVLLPPIRRSLRR